MKRISWIDNAKGLATLCIIFSHVTMYNYPSKFAMFLYGFEVTAFFILSGILFKRKLNKDFYSIFKDAIKNYAIPYFVCMMIIVLYRRFVLGHIFIDQLNFYMIQQRSGTLWFLPVIAISQIVCWALYKYTQNRKIQLIFIVLFTLLGAAFMDHFSRALLWNMDIVPFGTMYVYIGIQASDKLMNVKITNQTRVKLFALAILSGVIAYYGIEYNYIDKGLGTYISITNFNILWLAILSATLGSFALIFISMVMPNIPFLSMIGKKSLPMVAFNNDIASSLATIIPFIAATYRTGAYYRDILVFVAWNIIILLAIYPVYNYFRKILHNSLRKLVL